MTNKQVFINAKIQNAEYVNIYKNPDIKSEVLSNINKDRIYQVDVSRVYWSYDSTQFYRVNYDLAEGYIETFYVKLI